MRNLDSLKTPLLIVGGVFVFVAMALWGGMPPASAMPGFIAGVLALLLVGCLIGAAAWYVLLRPLPDGAKIDRKSPLPQMQRRVIGILLVLAMMAEAIGGVWDESWHRTYGIPFGKDFFWRPHILIYAGLLAITLFAGLGWIAMMRRGRGSLAQRFRADPVVGVLTLTGLFLLYALPTDPIWHSIYGTDLSAFSIPHVLLTTLLAFASLCGIALLMSTSPVRQWRSLARLTWEDVVPILALVNVLLLVLLLLTADWFGQTPQGLVTRTGIIFQRPEWLLPLFIVAVATLVGALANESLRAYGVATLVGILTFVLRLVLVNGFASPVRDANSWLLCLPSLVLIDVVYAYRIRQNRAVSWQMIGIAGALGLVVVLPLMNQLFPFPQVTASNILMMIVVPALGAMLMAWLGQAIGSRLADVTQPDTAEVVPVRTAQLTAAILVPVLVVIVWFVLTATPPTL